MTENMEVQRLHAANYTLFDFEFHFRGIDRFVAQGTARAVGFSKGDDTPSTVERKARSRLYVMANDSP